MIISQDRFFVATKCVSMNFPSPSPFLFYSKAMYWGTNFSSTHVRICVMDATPLSML